MEIFRSVGRGWAVRTMERLAKGKFVCEYAGEILTESTADDRDDDTYLFEVETVRRK